MKFLIISTLLMTGIVFLGSITHKSDVETVAKFYADTKEIDSSLKNGKFPSSAADHKRLVRMLEAAKKLNRN